MIRVLHVMGCADAGGISAVVLNYYRFIDRTKIHFDIALTVPEAGQNAHALEALGAEIFFLPLKSHGLSAFRSALAELLKNGKYDAVHVHESETSYVALQVAKALDIPCRIAHAHITSPWEGVKGELRRLSGCVLNYHYASHVIGCGQLAGERIFGKHNMKRPKALVLPNAVDTRKFSYDASVRQKVRQELGLENKYVIGMVGRLADQKNYPFALEVMAMLRHIMPDAVLVVAGNGPDEQLIKDQIKLLGLEETVRMLGRRSDVDRLYQAFDLFLMPSLYEGFPVAGVEALAAGLPVLLSDQITKELEMFTAVKYLSLSDVADWVHTIEALRNTRAGSDRRSEVAEHGFDLRDTAQILERVYTEDVMKKRGE